MNKFSNIVVKESTNFDGVDDFSIYKYIVQVNPEDFEYITSWILLHKTKFSDEFILDAFDDILHFIHGSLKTEVGLNFKYLSTKCSIYSLNKVLYFSFDKKINYKKVIGL